MKSISKITVYATTYFCLYSIINISRIVNSDIPNKFDFIFFGFVAPIVIGTCFITTVIRKTKDTKRQKIFWVSIALLFHISFAVGNVIYISAIWNTI